MLKGKKVLLVGLGVLGGGVASAKFLLSKGAKLAITDLKDKKALNISIKKLPKGINYTLGKHLKKDFDKAEVIVANPDVSVENQWIKYAKSQGKEVFNDLTLFLSYVEGKRDLIFITGTRGKTTIATWANKFISGSVLGGNIPELGPLKIVNRKGNPFVLETSSFQLEYIKKESYAPKVAVISNLYRDHLNRHKTMHKYLKAKSRIFLNQKEGDFLVLNYKNTYTNKFLLQNPKSQVFYFSSSELPKKINGIYFKNGNIYFQKKGSRKFIAKSPFLTDFENENLLSSMLAAYLYMGNWKQIIPKIRYLPVPLMRRQVIIRKSNLLVVNDTTSTMPEATMALLDQYSKFPVSEKILVAGGTDKKLDYKKWAGIVKKNISSDNLFLLEGTATHLMIRELRKLNYWKGKWPVVTMDLKDIVHLLSLRKGKKLILFSPGATSFQKFKNEFDRGKQFNKLAKKYLT